MSSKNCCHLVYLCFLVFFYRKTKMFGSSHSFSKFWFRSLDYGWGLLPLFLLSCYDLWRSDLLESVVFRSFHFFYQAVWVTSIFALIGMSRSFIRVKTFLVRHEKLTFKMPFSTLKLTLNTSIWRVYVKSGSLCLFKGYLITTFESGFCVNRINC